MVSNCEILTLSSFCGVNSYVKAMPDHGSFYCHLPSNSSTIYYLIAVQWMHYNQNRGKPYNFLSYTCQNRKLQNRKHTYSHLTLHPRLLSIIIGYYYFAIAKIKISLTCSSSGITLPNSIMMWQLL